MWCASTCADLTLPLHRYLQPSDVSHAVMSLLNQPRTACISDIQLQPLRDLFRQALFANVPALKALVKQPGPVPFVDARVALVTGAGKGIGRAVVLGLAQDGFDGVTVIARNKVLHARDRQPRSLPRYADKVFGCYPALFLRATSAALPRSAKPSTPGAACWSRPWTWQTPRR